MAVKEITKKKVANPVLEAGDAPVSAKSKSKAKVTPKEQPVKPKAETPVELSGEQNGAVEKTAAAPVKENTSVSLSKDQKRIEEMLKNSPTVQVYIPKEPHEPEDACEDVWINGFHVRIQKGLMQEVKKPIFDILNRKYKLTREALNRKTISSGHKPGLEEALN
jgi:hypothetical protein